MDTASLTFDELAERLGISGKSARNLVRRKGWSRTIGNDGKTRVTVPLEALPEAPPVVPSAAPSEPPPASPQEAPEAALMMARLESQIDGLKGIVAAEKARADAAERDRDRWHALATRPWWRRLVG